MENSIKPLPSDADENLLPPTESYSYVPRNVYVYFEGAESHPFQFNATRFEKMNAWWLSDAAMLAYSKEVTVRYWCEEAGFTDVKWYRSQAAQCFIAIRDEYVFVAFCQKAPPQKRPRVLGRLGDWRIRVGSPLVDFADRGSVNRRVHDALNQLWEAAPTSLYGTGLGEMLATIALEHPNATFWFTGHDFGGALATLAATRHGRVAGLYTFGAPMVGDRVFQRSFDLPAWRFVNKSDVLTRVPVIGLYRPFKIPIFGKYHPVGDLRFIDASGYIWPVEVMSSSLVLDPFTFLRLKLGLARKALVDHAPLQYSIRIWNAIADTAPAARERAYVLGNWFGVALRCAAAAVIMLLLILGAAVGLSFALRFLPEEPSDQRVSSQPIILETGLGSERQDFYSIAEGSEVFPRAFADAARQPRRSSRGVIDWIRSRTYRRKPFLENLERYGFIPVPKTIDNPYGYIGLTVRKRPGTGIEMIGVNCAACHVGQIEYQGKAIRIDGAPNMLDIFKFFDDLANSLSVRNALTSIDIPVLLNEWKVSLKDMSWDGVRVYWHQISDMKKLNELDNTLPLPGRADAFGTARAMFFGDFQPLTAPASYPHIWGLKYTAWYHWNANTNSILERNIGQALGLGAGINPTDCRTTIDLDALDQMENLAYKIQPPTWPQDLGALDMAAVARGRAIYMGRDSYNTPSRGGCARCHENYKTIPDKTVQVNDYRLLPLSVIGTDPNEAWNSAGRVFQRLDVCNGNNAPFERKGFGEAHEMLLGNVHTDAKVKSLSNNLLFNGGRSEPKWRSTALCQGESQGDPNASPRTDCPVYPAKPHLGVWATAPYLHNGSVPTLWDMLKAPQDRPQLFNVGQRQYDPIHVGYVQTNPPNSEYPIFDTSRPGNANSGHPFGIGLNDGEKRDLIEFMKSITPEVEKEMHEEILRRSNNQ